MVYPEGDYQADERKKMDKAKFKTEFMLATIHRVYGPKTYITTRSRGYKLVIMRQRDQTVKHVQSVPLKGRSRIKAIEHAYRMAKGCHVNAGVDSLGIPNYQEV